MTMKCRRPDCNEDGMFAHGSSRYCAMHARLLTMRTRGIRDGKGSPSLSELLALIPKDMRCPECQREMKWRSPDMKEVISLQHWKDGSVSLICHSCNSRLQSQAALPPVGFKLCPLCDEVKPLSDFQKDRSRFQGVFAYCRACNNKRVRA